MRRLFLFNPENDIALGQTDCNYTPTRAVRDFHDAGAALPLWYADTDGDMIYAPHASPEWIENRRQLFSLPAALYESEPHVRPAPWGFSMHALRQYIKMGVAIDPTKWDDKIRKIRDLSHRRTAAILMEKLRSRLAYRLPSTPVEARNISDLERFATAHPHFFMKAPWSSSGRGVVDCSAIPRKQILRQAEGIIRHQGSVMLEPALDKVVDFASLYHASYDGIRHIGYSMFFNSHGTTAYSGNHVASDDELLACIGRHIDEQCVVSTAAETASVLARTGIHHHYNGYFGVDMMVYRPSDGSEPLINPAVEINLRMTMGIVAHKLYKRIMSEGRHGILSVRYAPNEVYADNFIADGFRLCAGTLNLIPPHPGFRMTLAVEQQPTSL